MGLGLKSERVVVRGYSFQGAGVGSRPWVSLKESIKYMLQRQATRQLKCPVCAFVEKLNFMWFFIQLNKSLDIMGIHTTVKFVREPPGSNQKASLVTVSLYGLNFHFFSVVICSEPTGSHQVLTIMA